jgi:hypothetical protein
MAMLHHVEPHLVLDLYTLSNQAAGHEPGCCYAKDGFYNREVYTWRTRPDTTHARADRNSIRLGQVKIPHCIHTRQLQHMLTSSRC